MIIWGYFMDKKNNTYDTRKPVLYDAAQIQEIFHLDSISSARRLMNHPAFPSMRVGRKLLVLDWELNKFLAANGRGYIDLY